MGASAKVQVIVEVFVLAVAVPDGTVNVTLSLDVAVVSVGYHLSIHVPSPEFSAATKTVASVLSVVKTTGFEGMGLVADVFAERA